MKKVRVQCRDIGLSFGRTEVLRGVSLDVEPGEFFALLGPSGSGKSTLLRLIAGFNRQQRGSVHIDGIDVGGQPPWQRNVGMVFQSYALWPHLSVHDNVAFGLVERKVARAERARRVQAALELVGLASHAGRRPNQLSGGQQQRVALARTIVIEPQVLLLDEPLSNLDRSLRVQMRQELLALQRRLGLTTIFVTHDQEEAMSTADRMAVLDQGVLQQVGTPAQLYDRPANAFVAGFVGTMNFVPARVVAQRGGRADAEIEGWGRLPDVELDSTWASQEGTMALAATFRPEALRIAAPDSAGDADSLRMPAIVESMEFLGEATRYRLRAGGHLLTADERHRSGSRPLAIDDAVVLRLDATQVRLLARTKDR